LPDALPPALYGVLTAPLPIPTADLAVHLTADAHLAEPAAWYLVLIRTEAARDGWSLDASSVWNADGQLMALARQTRRVLKGA
jgi:acyl-CoA thioesterase